MYAEGLGKFHTVNAFVHDKISRFQTVDKSFASIYTFIQSEPDNIFCESNDGYRITSVTYREFDTHCRQFASVMQGYLQHFSAGSAVGLYMDNSEQWLEIFWAVLMCGFEPLLLNKRLSDSLLNDVLRSANPCFVITDSKAFSIPFVHINELISSEKDAVAMDLDRASWGDEIILISSGTSSHVKLSYYNGENMYWQICDSARIVRQSKLMKKHYKGRLKLLTFLPFYHIFGLVAVFMWFAFFSRSFVLLKDYSATTIINTIKRHRVTHIFAVPLFWDTVYKEAMKKISAKGSETVQKLEHGFSVSDKLSKFPMLYRAFSSFAYKEVRDGLFGNSISFMISGGAAIPSDTLRFFNHIGYRLANGYGMTEVGITSVELSDKPNVLISGSVGVPFLSVEYSISGNSELLVRGKTPAHAIVADGVRRERRPEEWFITNDRAEYRNGRYYILGRADDLLIGPNGENIDPDRVESELHIAHSPARCLVRSGEASAPGTLVISISRLINQSTLDEIRLSAEEELNRLGLAGTVGRIYMTFDPLLGANDFKANRRKLEKLLKENGLSDANCPIDTEERSNELTMQVRQVFAEILGRDLSEIGPNAHFFFDLGGSSLDYLSAMMRLQNDFQIGFPTGEGNGLSTAKEIAAFIEKNAGDL